MTPRTSVSAVVITHNGERYLAEQLASIIGQTRQPDEIVLSDDASNDKTVERARDALASFHGQLHIQTSPTRRGVSSNLQSALKIATGDVLILSDQDDVWSPTRVASQVAVMERDRSVAAAFCDAELIDAASQATGERLWERFGFSSRRRAEWQRDPAAVLLKGTFVTGATLALRRELLDLVLPFPASGWHDSWIAMLAVFSGARVVALEEVLLSYRLHGENAAGVPLRGWESRLAAARWPGPAAIAQWSDAADRLRANTSDRSHERSLGADRLARAGSFHRRRANLDPRLWRRTPTVCRWWVTGAYSRFGSGTRTAAADLAVAALGWTNGQSAPAHRHEAT
jgi:glycosyltransferase involved in cell wall biosynthesis